jgi:hypothetical protein
MVTNSKLLPVCMRALNQCNNHRIGGGVLLLHNKLVALALMSFLSLIHDVSYSLLQFLEQPSGSSGVDQVKEIDMGGYWRQGGFYKELSLFDHGMDAMSLSCEKSTFDLTRPSPVHIAPACAESLEGFNHFGSYTTFPCISARG